MSTLKTTNLQNASAASPAIVLAADGSATAQLSSLNGGPLGGSRNRIINGDMRIDQRNAGASVTPGAGGIYTLDRWVLASSTGSKFSIQQNAGSVTPPPGFSKYLGLTVVSSVSVGSGDYWALGQNIEGFNIDSLAFGTASPQSVTVSFWVRSSLTGTFGGSLRNGASNRSYPFTYSITASNTWEYKALTIAGDTTGTWSSDNSTGLTLWLGLGVGSSNSGTAGSWTGSGLLSATGATSVVGTNGATFYITGVQLEPGTVATPFERRSYGQELALCQRYYSAGNYYCVLPAGSSGTLRRDRVPFPVAMRATSVTVNDGAGNTNKVYRNANNQSMTIFNYDPLAFAISVTTGGAATGDDLFFNWTCTGEL